MNPKKNTIITTLKTGVRSYVNDKGEAFNECLNCGSWFKPKRKNKAKFCCESCRVNHHIKNKPKAQHELKEERIAKEVEKVKEEVSQYLNEEDMGTGRKRLVVYLENGKLNVKRE